MAAPTSNDWKQFKTMGNNDKANVLYAYLCEGYNMEDTARNALGDYSDMASLKVSNITRCYGFGGKNAGRYRRYDLTLKDIKEFVRKYPNGCSDCAVMDDYVKNLGDRPVRNVQQREPVYVVKEADNSEAPTPDTNWEEMDEKVYRILTVITLGAFIIFKAFMGWGWISSIIMSCLIMTFLILIIEK